METVATPVVVKKSRSGTGQGLFVAVPIKKGDFILEYTGKRIPTPFADTMKSRYLFEIDSDWTIDGSPRSNIARYINHSCAPNAEAEIHDGRIVICAVRNIDKDEEVTIDYDTEYFDEFIRPVGCKCTKCAATPSRQAVPMKMPAINTNAPPKTTCAIEDQKPNLK